MITMLPGMRGVGGQRVSPAKISTLADLLIDYFDVIKSAEPPAEMATTDMGMGILCLSLIVQQTQQEPVLARMGLAINNQLVVDSRTGAETTSASLGSFINNVRTVYGPTPLPEAANVAQQVNILYEIG